MILHPELFRGFLAFQPFLDVEASVQDPSRRYTIWEYQEWGRNLPTIRQYSPVALAKAHPVARCLSFLIAYSDRDTRVPSKDVERFIGLV